MILSCQNVSKAFGTEEILKKYNLPDIDLDRLIDEKDLEEELNKND